MENHADLVPQPRTGWISVLAKIAMAGLLFEGISGLAITFRPFHPVEQWSVLVHTLAGLAILLPLAWYCVYHWLDYRRYALSHIVLLGFVGVLALLICSLSGVVLTWQGGLGIRISGFWRKIHLISTFVALGTILPHVVFSFLRAWREGKVAGVAGYAVQTVGASVAGAALIGGLTQFYGGTRYVNEFPGDYHYLFGTNRPFAQPGTDGYRIRLRCASLAGSASCGTAGCHEQIMRWQPSAHRYAAMDSAF